MDEPFRFEMCSIRWQICVWHDEFYNFSKTHKYIEIKLNWFLIANRLVTLSFFFEMNSTRRIVSSLIGTNESKWSDHAICCFYDLVMAALHREIVDLILYRFRKIQQIFCWTCAMHFLVVCQQVENCIRKKKLKSK